MRVLLVNTYHYARGGDSVHALALGSALEDAGHEVRFFGMQHPDNLPSPDSQFWMPHIDFADLDRSKSARAAIRVLRRSLYSVDAAHRIHRIIEDWRPDIAHLHSIHGHLSLSVLVELHKAGIPVVWTLHDWRLLCPNSTLMVRGMICELCRGGRFRQCVLNRCKKESRAASLVATLEAEVQKVVDVEGDVSRFVAPSMFMLNKFRDFGWDTSKFVHIPNFAPRDASSNNRKPIAGRFLYTGRLSPEKGVRTLLKAIGDVDGASLDVAGEGPIDDDLRTLAREIAPGRVTFHGRVDSERLAALRDSAVAVVVPSEWYENSPLAVAESLARGCPVVAADIGGLPELVAEGTNGLLFASGDAEGLARVLETLVGDVGLGQHLSRGALSEASVFGVEDYVKRLQAVYDDACRLVNDR